MPLTVRSAIHFSKRKVNRSCIWFPFPVVAGGGGSLQCRGNEVQDGKCAAEAEGGKGPILDIPGRVGKVHFDGVDSSPHEHDDRDDDANISELSELLQNVVCNVGKWMSNNANE